jgi:aminoglycoside phosphotransferase (APT) family kinase protein
MLRPDPHLPQRDVVFSRDQVAELLDREVLPALRPGTRVGSLDREYTAYKAGKDCLVHYSLEPEGGGEPVRVTLTLGRPDRLQTLHARHYAATGDRKPGGGLLLSGLPCLAEVFPSDWKLGHLREAMDPHRASTLLARRDVSSELRGVDVVRYRPRRRCVLRYRHGAASRDGAPEADAETMAKVYAYAWKATEVREKLRVLGPMARARGLDLPRSRETSPDLAVVVMERLPGTNLSELLGATGTSAEADALVGAAARALAIFHSLELPVTPATETRHVEDEITKLRVRSSRWGEVSPSVTARVEALVTRVARLHQRLGRDAERLVHGDYKPSQLLLDDRGVPGLVDLDRACPGDPAIDLGNFLAVLAKQEVLKGQAHVARAGESFLEAYHRDAGQPASDERARLFEAFALVRMLVRKLERSPHGLLRYRDQWLPLALLDRAEGCLAAFGAA